MRFDSRKSFGYPVLRHGSDDYIDSGITASMELEHSGDESPNSFFADYSLMVGVKELVEAVKVGDVVVVIQVFCPRTLWSDRLITREFSGKKPVDLSEVKGELVVTLELAVARDGFLLQSTKIHPEFGGGGVSFNLSRGDVVAQPEPMKLFIDRDLFKPVASLFKWSVDDGVEDGKWELDWSGEYVNIIVSAEQRRLIASFQENSKGQAVLVNSIFLPAMSKLIEQLVAEPDNPSLWAKTLSQRLTNISVDVGRLETATDSVKHAQLLLESPLRRINKHLMVED